MHTAQQCHFTNKQNTFPGDSNLQPGLRTFVPICLTLIPYEIVVPAPATFAWVGNLLETQTIWTFLDPLYQNLNFIKIPRELLVLPLQLFCKSKALLKLKVFIRKKKDHVWDTNTKPSLQKLSLARRKLIKRHFAERCNGSNVESVVTLWEEMKDAAWRN